jgi:hypothetical protein
MQGIPTLNLSPLSRGLTLRFLDDSLLPEPQQPWIRSRLRAAVPKMLLQVGGSTAFVPVGEGADAKHSSGWRRLIESSGQPSAM